MAGGRDNLTLLDDFLAGLADLIAGVAVFRAGSFLRANDLGIVAGSLDFLGLRIGVGLALELHGSGVGADALLGAGRLGGHFIGDLRVNDFNMGLVVCAGEGRGSALQAGPSPSGLAIGVAGCGNHGAVLDGVAVLAVDGLAAVLGAGRSLVDGEVSFPIVSGRVKIFNLGVLADGAGVHPHALLLALRSDDGDPFAVGVAICGDLGDILLRIALLAMDGLAACNGAGGLHIDRVVSFPVMAGRLDVSGLGVLADGADALLKALAFAGRSDDGFPFAEGVTLRRSGGAGGNLLTADGAVGVAGVAFERAGGVVCVLNLGVLVELRSQSLGDVNMLVVDLGLMDGDFRIGVNLGGIDAEGQGRNDRAGSDAVEIDIAEGDLAGLILVRGVVGEHGHIGQSENAGIVFDSGQAVGGGVFALGDNIHGDGLLIVGNGDVGSGFTCNRSLERQNRRGLCGGDSIQGAGGSLLALAVAANLVSGQLDGFSAEGFGLVHGLENSVGNSFVLVVDGADQVCGPHAVPEGADKRCIPGALVREEDTIDVAGIASKVGQIQNNVFTLDGGVQGIVHIAFIGGVVGVADILQVGLEDAEGSAPGRIALVVKLGIGVHRPDIARIVQEQEHLGGGVLHAVLIGVNLDGAERGNSGEVGCAGVEQQI